MQVARADIVVGTFAVFGVLQLAEPVQSGVIDGLSNVAAEIESTMVTTSQD
jgi:hypothetical protein